MSPCHHEVILPYHGGHAPANVDKLEWISCLPKCEGHDFVLEARKAFHMEATLFS